MLLLAIAYAFAFLLYKRIEKSSSAEINVAFLKDFRLFYKLAIYGTLCTAVIGLSWWLTTNITGLYTLRKEHSEFKAEVARLEKENEQLADKLANLNKSRYFVYDGVIATGVGENEILDASLASGPDRPFLFMAFRDPVQKLLKFQVSSIEPMNKIKSMQILIWYKDKETQAYKFKFVTVRFKITGIDTVYKFTKIADGFARIEPAMIPPH